MLIKILRKVFELCILIDIGRAVEVCFVSKCSPFFFLSIVFLLDLNCPYFICCTLKLKTKFLNFCILVKIQKEAIFKGL